MLPASVQSAFRWITVNPLDLIDSLRCHSTIVSTQLSKVSLCLSGPIRGFGTPGFNSLLRGSLDMQARFLMKSKISREGVLRVNLGLVGFSVGSADYRAHCSFREEPRLITSVHVFHTASR